MDIIPLGTQSLPLENSPLDKESENYTVVFSPSYENRIKATIYDEDDFIIDIINEGSFQEAYESVIRYYPQATWINPKE